MRFLHAADLHLDTPPSGVRGYPDEVAAVLRDASLDAFDALVRTALDEQVAFCVFAGDVYDGADRGVRAQLRFRAGLERLADAGIRSFVVHGNHDPVEEGWTAVRSWPDLVHVFPPGEPTSVAFDVDGRSVVVHGVSYAERATTDNLAVRFRRAPGEAFQVGVLHANLGSAPDHEPYAPCTEADLRGTGLDYWALGHVHTRWISPDDRPRIVYPGNLQGRSPKPAEQGAKGAVVVEVDDGGGTTCRHVPLDVARFVATDVEVDDVDDLGRLADVLAERGLELLDEHAPRSLVVRARLSGRGGVHVDLRRPGALDELRHELHRVDAAPFLWWDRLEDATGSDVDLDRVAGRDDLVGHVVAALDPADPDDALAGLADELPDLRRTGVDAPDLADPALLDRARRLAHDLLEGDPA